MSDTDTFIEASFEEEPTPPPPANFTCEVCQRNFNSQGALSVHARSHEGKKPCPECGALYHMGPGMSRHRQAAHGVMKANGEAPKKGGAPLKKSSRLCPQCGKTLRADNLTRHLANVHGEAKQKAEPVDLTSDDLFTAAVGMLFPNGVVPVDKLLPLLRWRHATDEMLLEVAGER